MEIAILSFLSALNGLFCYVTYKQERYKDSVFHGFTCGFVLAATLMIVKTQL